MLRILYLSVIAATVTLNSFTSPHALHLAPGVIRGRVGINWLSWRASVGRKP